MQRGRAIRPLPAPSAPPLIQRRRPTDPDQTELRSRNSDATVDLSMAEARPEDVGSGSYEGAATLIDEPVEQGAGLAPQMGAEASVLPAGTEMGRYLIERPLGRGGMGYVYLVREKASKKRFALKSMNQALNEEPVALDRFRREVMALAKVDHPNVIKLHDYGQAQDRHYYVMDYVRGRDLKVELDKLGRLKPREAARLIAACARALHAAHTAGLVHRDVKPSNILIEEGGGPILTDFGLVRLEGHSSLTVAGDVVGTPAYMSPEQANGLRAEVSSDIFSLGSTLYHAAVGRRPYDGVTARAILLLLLTEAPKAPSRVVDDFPRDLESIIARAMARDPGARYESAQAFAEDLEAFASGEAIRATGGAAWEAEATRPPRNPWPAAFAALVLAVAGAAFALGPWRAAPEPREAPPTEASSKSLAATPILDDRLDVEVPPRADDREVAAARLQEYQRPARELIDSKILGFDVEASARERAEALLAAARGYRSDGEVTRAFERVDECLSCAPGHADGRLFRAELYRERGEPERAIADLTVLVELSQAPSSELPEAKASEARLARAQAFYDLKLSWADHLAESDLVSVREDAVWRGKLIAIDAAVRRKQLEKARYALEALLPEIEARQLLGRGIYSADEYAGCFFDAAQLICKLGGPRAKAQELLKEALRVADSTALAGAIGELLGRLGS